MNISDDAQVRVGYLYTRRDAPSRPVRPCCRRATVTMPA